MMKQNKEPTIRIKNILTKCDEEVSVTLYYKIFCRKIVSKYFHIYRKVFASQGLELEDLKQDILLMLWKILKENDVTKKIDKDKIGGYLFNATKQKLNTVVAKSLTRHRRMVSLNVYHADTVYQEEQDVPELLSDKVLRMLDEDKKGMLSKTIKKVCTEREALTLKKYYFDGKSMIETGLDMEVSKQRISALIKQALSKLKIHFDKIVKEK